MTVTTENTDDTEKGKNNETMKRIFYRNGTHGIDITE